MQRISNESFNELIRVVETFMALSFRFKLALKQVLYETAYQKDARVLNFGETQKFAWFLLEGLFREIRINKSTLKKMTSWFWLESDFCYTDPGFFSQQPSLRAIEALENSRVVLISYLDWSQLKTDFKETETVTEMIRGAYHRQRLEHIEDMKLLAVDERYLDREELLDGLFPRTQLKYISDFMGMAPDTLGRLRSKYLGRRK